MIIYHYHPATGLYLGTSEADPDPLTLDGWLLPAHATPVAPPDVSEPHQVQMFCGGAWTLVPDWRGTDYWLADGSKQTITLLGETVPAGASLTQPPEPITQEQFALRVERAVDAMVEQTARARGYGTADGERCRDFCLDYASFPNPYQAEAIAYGQWLSSLWPVLWGIQAQYVAGTRELPMTVPEADAAIAGIMTELPAMVWPA